MRKYATEDLKLNKVFIWKITDVFCFCFGIWHWQNIRYFKFL